MDAGERSALLALGRLAEAYEASPFALAWEARERAGAAARLAAADGLGFDPDRVFRLAHDLPVRRELGDLGDAAVTQILGLLALPLAAEGEGEESRDPWRSELAIAEGTFRDEGHPLDLTTLLRALHRWLAEGGRPSVGYLALIRELARRGVTPAPLSALIRPAGLVRASPATWTERAVTSLADAAVGGRHDLIALRQTIEGWRQRLGKRRRQSRLDALVVDLAGMPVTTPSTVARRLGLSVRGASVMLEELARLGIVSEITGRQSWKTYVAATGGAAQDRSRMPGPRQPPQQQPDLSPLLSDADEAILRVRAAVDRARERIDRDRRALSSAIDEEPEDA
ncbi:MAG: hypothetical protein FJX54_08215 [Alphaproteobacteria bacterium]|nr:hypothetical protein [Alphaproteobacteria bacterium]